MKIPLNISHADEASEANYHEGKRTVNCQPFMQSVYSAFFVYTCTLKLKGRLIHLGPVVQSPFKLILD